jgi:Carboxymuconolactone decarboxylase family
MDERKRHAKGMRVRRSVLGDAHVDRAEADKSSFTAPFQDLITRYAWGEIWSRPELPRKTRSMITIAESFRRTADAPARRGEQWRQPQGNSGVVATNGGLLRRPGSKRGVSHRGGGIPRGARIMSRTVPTAGKSQ